MRWCHGIAGLLGTAFLAVPPAAPMGGTARADARDAYPGCFDSVDIDEVIAECSRAIASGTLDRETLAEAHFWRGMAYYEHYVLTPALADFDAAIRLDDSDPDYRFFRAITYRLAGRAAESIADLDEILRRDPGQIGPRSHRARAHALLGDVEAALADFDAALERLAGSVPVLMSRGALLLQIGEPQAALADFDAVLGSIAEKNAGTAAQGIFRLLWPPETGSAAPPRVDEIVKKMTPEITPTLTEARGGRLAAQVALGHRAAARPPDWNDPRDWHDLPGTWLMALACGVLRMGAGILPPAVPAAIGRPGIEIRHEDWTAIVIAADRGLLRVRVRDRAGDEDRARAAGVVRELSDCIARPGWLSRGEWG